MHEAKCDNSGRGSGEVQNSGDDDGGMIVDEGGGRSRQ